MYLATQPLSSATVMIYVSADLPGRLSKRDAVFGVVPTTSSSESLTQE